MTATWNVIGVDPAPTKCAVVCFGSGQFARVEPGDLRLWLEERLVENKNVLVAWDAPLSFDSIDFYDRRIDKVVRKWVTELVGAGVVAPKAVNARCFAGLPHWAVSCQVVGYPFSSGSRILELVSKPARGHCLVEVHPAAALAAWWSDRRPKAMLERYKGKKPVAARIADILGFPETAGVDDDHLDAYTAYKLGSLLLAGKARLVGSIDGGGYVMPDGPACQTIEAMFGTPVAPS